MLATYFKNVTYKYNDRVVINDLSMSIDKSKWVCIKGRNGCGKSTLAKLAAGLILPNEGNIEIFGCNTKDNAQPFRKDVGIVLQDFETQIFHSYVEDDIAFGLENIGIDNKDIPKRVIEVAKLCHIEHLLESEIFNLSGGQKQMVAFAGAIAIHPKLLILDEASSHLDDEYTKIFYSTLTELKRNATTIIEINHLDIINKNVDEIINL